MSEAIPQNVKYYRDPHGYSPFADWLNKLDSKTRAKILARIARVEAGNFGDSKSLVNTNRISELREHFGPGYRIYYTRIENTVVLLLCGSTKSNQNRMIAKAQDYLYEYVSRS